MYKAVIFDMDGVLVDSQALHYEVDMAVLKRADYTATLELVVSYTGMSNPDRWLKYKNDLNLSPTVKTLSMWQTEIVLEMFKAADLTAIKGIPELLEHISGKGLKIGLASASQSELIRIILQKLNINRYFKVIVSGEDVKTGKPAPDVYLKAADLLGVSPKDCAVIEDSTHGIMAAKSAGMMCIAYNNSTTKGQNHSQADYVTDNYEDCYSWLS